MERFVQSDAFDRILVLTESRNLDFRKEALFVMVNAITGSDLKLRAQIFDKSHGHILKVMVNALVIIDKKLTSNTLEALDDLLALDEWYGTKGTDSAMTLQFELHGGLDILEEVMKNPN